MRSLLIIIIMCYKKNLSPLWIIQSFGEFLHHDVEVVNLVSELLNFRPEFISDSLYPLCQVLLDNQLHSFREGIGNLQLTIRMLCMCVCVCVCGERSGLVQKLRMVLHNTILYNLLLGVGQECAELHLCLFHPYIYIILVLARHCMNAVSWHHKLTVQVHFQDPWCSWWLQSASSCLTQTEIHQ